MKKQIVVIVAFVLIGLTVMSIHAQTKETAPTEADYTDWLFVQSDKALQRRFAVAKKEGNVSYLKIQFRVKSDDEIHCRGPQCDGYVLYMSHDNVARTETVKYHLYFEPSFVGDKIYNFTELIPVELKTWEDGARRYIDKKRGIVVSYANGEVVNAQYFYNCVDFKLKNEPKHRCDDFDMSKAIRVSESNVVETKSSSQEKKADISNKPLC